MSESEGVRYATADKLKFVTALPKTVRGLSAGGARWEAIRAALMAHPNVWAIVYTGKVGTVPSGHRSSACARLGAGFEVVQRKHIIYARYVGESQP